jgi:hypothetical protein
VQGERRTFISGFQEDIFISFRHVDNMSGWVSDLHSFLHERLPQILGKDCRIWRDPRLRGGELLWPTLEQVIPRSFLFLSILTPSFFSSDGWCLDEARCFCEAAQAGGGLLVDTTCRLLRLVKTPFDRTQEPGFLKELEPLEFRFFEEVQFAEDSFTEFPTSEQLPGFHLFAQRREELAQALAGILQKGRRRLGTPGTPRSSVFLAGVTTDRRDDRNFLAAELEGSCEIVSPAELTGGVEAWRERLGSQLTRCALSVHLLGASFGAVPEGDERSLPEVQLVLAASAKIRRFVWIPHNLSTAEPRQQRLLKELGEVEDPRMEVIRCRIDDFVPHLKAVLAGVSLPKPPAAPGKAIYLAFAKEDAASPQLKTLIRCLREKGFRFEPSVLEGGPEQQRRAEELALGDSSAAIIYFGEVGDDFVYFRHKGILKMLASLGRATTYRCALYLGAPVTDGKRIYMELPGGEYLGDVGLPLLILGDCGELSCEKVQPLLAEATARS